MTPDLRLIPEPADPLTMAPAVTPDPEWLAEQGRKQAAYAESRRAWRRDHPIIAVSSETRVMQPVAPVSDFLGALPGEELATEVEGD